MFQNYNGGRNNKAILRTCSPSTWPTRGCHLESTTSVHLTFLEKTSAEFQYFYTTLKPMGKSKVLIKSSNNTFVVSLVTNRMTGLRYLRWQISPKTILYMPRRRPPQSLWTMGSNPVLTFQSLWWISYRSRRPCKICIVACDGFRTIPGGHARFVWSRRRSALERARVGNVSLRRGLSRCASDTHRE